jgi:CBS domain-containing protein
MRDLLVRDLMSDHVISVHPGDSVDKVYDAMTERGIRHIAVTKATWWGWSRTATCCGTR